LLLASVLAGCSETRTDRETATQARSPGALVESFVRSFTTKDKELLRACFEPGGKGKAVADLLATNFEVDRAAREFRKAVENKFGRACAAAHMLKSYGVLESMNEYVQKARLQVDGDTASLVVSDAAFGGEKIEPSKIIKRGDAWYFEVPESLDTDRQGLRRAAKWMNDQVRYYQRGKLALEAAVTAKDFASRMERVMRDLG